MRNSKGKGDIARHKMFGAVFLCKSEKEATQFSHSIFCFSCLFSFSRYILERFFSIWNGEIITNQKKRGNKIGGNENRPYVLSLQAPITWYDVFYSWIGVVTVRHRLTCRGGLMPSQSEAITESDITSWVYYCCSHLIILKIFYFINKNSIGEVLQKFKNKTNNFLSKKYFLKL